MPDENAAVLEFAAILGEAIARAHLSGKSVNAQVDGGRSMKGFRPQKNAAPKGLTKAPHSVGFTQGVPASEHFTTKTLSRR